jgi:hypothetical protein
MAVDTLRQAEFPYAPPGPPFKRDDFLALIEQEDLQKAEGMVARALQDGMHWSDLEEAFAYAALATTETSDIPLSMFRKLENCSRTWVRMLSLVCYPFKPDYFAMRHVTI